MALLIHTTLTVLAATGLGLAVIGIMWTACLMWAERGEEDDRVKGEAH